MMKLNRPRMGPSYTLRCAAMPSFAIAARNLRFDVLRDGRFGGGAVCWGTRQLHKF
jgi:hypothetical protein